MAGSLFRAPRGAGTTSAAVGGLGTRSPTPTAPPSMRAEPGGTCVPATFSTIRPASSAASRRPTPITSGTWPAVAPSTAHYSRCAPITIAARPRTRVRTAIAERRQGGGSVADPDPVAIVWGPFVLLEKTEDLPDHEV